jgi:integrase/recombinase XerD
MKYLNYAESSIDETLWVLKRFDNYLRLNGLKDYREVSEKDYYGYMEYAGKIAKHGIRDNTLNTYGVRLKRVFIILEEEEKILINPFADIEILKERRNIRDMVLSETEMREVLESIDINDPHGFRNRTIFEVLYGTGIRAREIINLELRDFLKEEKMLFIRNGKGKKDRIIPLGPSVIEYLTKYLKYTRRKFVKKGRRAEYIFLSQRGGKITTDGLEAIFTAVRKNCPVQKHFSPHVIRHSFATHLINAGADIRDVQMLLGHAMIKSTEVYLNLATAHLKEVYEKYHPLENELFFDVYGRESYVLNWPKKRGEG